MRQNGGIFSLLRKCGICRLRVERPSDTSTALAAFCRVPDNEHRLCLWRSASFPLFADLSGCTAVPLSVLISTGHAFPAADCLFVLLVAIKVHVLISSTQSYYNIITD